MGGLMDRVARYISDGVPGADPGVIHYGLFSLVTFIAGYVLLGVLSYALNIFAHTMTAGVFAQILRVFTGGSHASSPWRCLIIGTVVFLFLGKTAQYVLLFHWPAFYYIAPGVVGVFGIAAIYRYGYATTHKKPLGSYRHGRKLRSRAAAFTLAWLCAVYYMVINNPQTQFERIFVASTLLGLTWQFFSLTPAGYRFSETADNWLRKMHVG